MRTTIDQRIVANLRRGPLTRGQLLEILGVSSSGLQDALVRLRRAGACEPRGGRWHLLEDRATIVA